MNGRAFVSHPLSGKKQPGNSDKPLKLAFACVLSPLDPLSGRVIHSSVLAPPLTLSALLDVIRKHKGVVLRAVLYFPCTEGGGSGGVLCALTFFDSPCCPGRWPILSLATRTD